MFSAFVELLETKTEATEPERERVTPGHLFRILSADFHGGRAPCTCEMPMLYLQQDTGVARVNWGLHRGASLCEACGEVIERMIARYAERYELTDPYGWSPDDLRIE